MTQPESSVVSACNHERDQEEKSNSENKAVTINSHTERKISGEKPEILRTNTQKRISDCPVTNINTHINVGSQNQSPRFQLCYQQANEAHDSFRLKISVEAWS